MNDDEEKGPDTPIQCQACVSAGNKGCPWCYGVGLIDERTLGVWKKWREMQRTTSSAHNILEGIVRDVMRRLKESDVPGAQALRFRAEELIDEWKNATEQERPVKTAALMDWHRDALEKLLPKPK